MHSAGHPSAPAPRAQQQQDGELGMKSAGWEEGERRNHLVGSCGSETEWDHRNLKMLSDGGRR